MTLLIPDLSEFQPNASMPGIRKMNGGAAVIRAAYGAVHADHVFSQHRTAAAGFRFLGIYQYLVASQDAIKQAAAFVHLVGKLGPHEVPVLDLEEGDGSQHQRALDWCGYVDTHLGKKSWVYSGEAFAGAHGLAPIFASVRHTWVAAYRDSEPELGHTLWQCTDGQNGPHRTSWPGAGACDTNVFHGSIDQLAALTGAPSYPAS